MLQFTVEGDVVAVNEHARSLVTLNAPQSRGSERGAFGQLTRQGRQERALGWAQQIQDATTPRRHDADDQQPQAKRRQANRAARAGPQAAADRSVGGIGQRKLRIQAVEERPNVGSGREDAQEGRRRHRPTPEVSEPHSRHQHHSAWSSISIVPGCTPVKLARTSLSERPSSSRQ